MWELCGEDTVSDNDTSGEAAPVLKDREIALRVFSRQLPAGFFVMTKGENDMDTKKLLRYTMQLAMLKQLLTKKLIDENEYLLIQKRLMKDYGIVSNITA